MKLAIEASVAFSYSARPGARVDRSDQAVGSVRSPFTLTADRSCLGRMPTR